MLEGHKCECEHHHDHDHGHSHSHDHSENDQNSCCSHDHCHDEPAQSTDPRPTAHSASPKKPKSKFSNLLTASSYSLLGLMVLFYAWRICSKKPHSHYPLTAYVSTDVGNLWVKLSLPDNSESVLYQMFKVPAKTGDKCFTYHLEKSDLVLRKAKEGEVGVQWDVYGDLSSIEGLPTPLLGDKKIGCHGTHIFVQEGCEEDSQNHKGCSGKSCSDESCAGGSCSGKSCAGGSCSNSHPHKSNTS